MYLLPFSFTKLKKSSKSQLCFPDFQMFEMVKELKKKTLGYTERKFNTYTLDYS